MARRTTTLLDDALQSAIAKVQQSLAPRRQQSSTDTTTTSAPVPRLAADSPLGKQIVQAMQRVTAATAGQPRREPTAAQRMPTEAESGEMRAGAAAASAKAVPGMVARLEAEQQRRRQAKGLPAYARGGVVRARSTAKAAPKRSSTARTTTRSATSRSGTSSRSSPSRSTTSRSTRTAPSRTPLRSSASRSSARTSSGSRGGGRGRR